ncbi:lipid-A-disaccharide synthase [Alistipes sp.]|jgi:lipid-A-disaccharide synthase|nr:lipid-A-disaccharide synthase [Alistipes sp.]
MKYYIIAGEPSGDLHGANLIRGLLAADPAAELRFWGGDMMAEAGGERNLVKHYRETSFFGFVQVVRHLPTILRQIGQCRRDIDAFAPDAVILIDYPGFNMKIARFAHRRGYKVFYYIAPKVWAWKERRVKELKRYVDRLFIIFPFERDYFRSKGIEPLFEGNPLVDAIESRRAAWPSREEFARRNALGDKPLIALLAGSRRSEIRDNLADMARLAAEFPDYRFVVAGVDWIDRAAYEKYLSGTGIGFVCGQTYELLSVSEAALVTSGTATLETALIGTPEIVLYHIPWLYEKLRPIFLKIPYISLVNINLGREAVREIVASRFDLDAARRELQSILTGGSDRERMLGDFARLREIIGPAGASERFARRMVDILRNDSK